MTPEAFARWTTRHLTDLVTVQKNNGRDKYGADVWQEYSANTRCLLVEGVGLTADPRVMSAPFQDELIVMGRLDLPQEENQRWRFVVTINRPEKDGDGQIRERGTKVLEAVSIEAPKPYEFDNYLTVVRCVNG